MEKNNISNTEDIHVKVDQNNLIYIDPNSTIDNQGNISPRNIKVEKLVMYVNLEADIISRSTLTSNTDSNTLTSIASGTLNFLKNGDGQDYDTSWTNAFLNTQEKKDGKGNPTGEFYQSDKSGQTFGINDIKIDIKGFNAIPTVTINFLDVRGKTLFESPENSPYKAFFHIPWPIFYLTVKGFYGKAIKYRLHLVKFSSKFNESNGNFEVNTSFVGSTYAWLSDIPLQGILNAPYLFPSESVKKDKTNTVTLQELETIKKSSKGYEILKTVYNEYKLKGLIPDDFPIKTLREVLTIGETLDSLLEKQIFDQVVDMRLFAAMKEFGENIDDFEKSIRGWAKERLENTPVTSLNDFSGDPLNPIQWYYVNEKDKIVDGRKFIDGQEEGRLERLFNLYIGKDGKITKSQLFAENLIKGQPTMINNTGSSFTKGGLRVSTIGNVGLYVKEDKEKKVVVKIDELINGIREIRKNFQQQRDKLEKDVEKKMNEIVRNKKNGFGFEPTIRNLFAVILSNAEVLIRIMKDVHKKAFDQADTRKKIVGDFSKESKGESIYPWPELKATVLNKENTIIYPGDPDFQTLLGSDNSVRWPEVAFLESYIGIATNKVDPLAEKESDNSSITNQPENDVDIKKIKKISTSNGISNIIPYVNKEPDSFLYEIYERAFNSTLIDSFNAYSIEQLVNVEFNNISESVKNEGSLRKILKQNVSNKTTLINQLNKLSPFEKYSYYKDNLPTTNYIKALYEVQSFNIEQYQISNDYNDKKSLDLLDKELQNYIPETYRKNIYPFSSNTYLNYIETGRTSIDDNLLDCKNFLNVDTTQGFISGKIDPKFWVKNSGATVNLFSQKFNVVDTSTNILNTPYFHKQLFSDFNDITINSSYGKYAGSAYLLLNSLPFVGLDEIKTENGNKVLISSLFREIGSSQYIPYHLMLKWGSIYHRYKKYLTEGKDILGDHYDSLGNLTKEGCITTGFTTNTINGTTFFDNNNTLSFNLSGITVSYSSNLNVGIHPYYDDVFHSVVNGYSYYDFVTGSTTGYTESISRGVLNVKNDTKTSTGGTLNYWTQYVDNSKLDTKDKKFTLLPSAGGNSLIGQKKSKIGESTSLNNTFSIEEQNYFRIIWDDELLNDNFSGKTFNSPIECETTISGSYGIGSNYKKVMDLIATFSPPILDEFEKYFLNFASERFNLTVSDEPFQNVVYSNFQDLLEEIVTVTKKTDDTSIQIQDLKNKQKTNLESITNFILSNNNLIKITIGNPKEIDPHSLIGFIGKNKDNSFTYKSYDSSTFDRNLMNLYLGIEPEKFSGSTLGCYEDFFFDNNVEFSEENLLIFRPIIYIYAGFKKLNLTNKLFKDYLNEQIFTEPGGANYRVDKFLQELTLRFKEFNFEENQTKIQFFDGYNNKPLKVELYNFFKSMNDKWIAGNSIGQKSLLEEFLFLDKANKDIGNDYYFDITRLKSLGDPKNVKQSLYSSISILLQGTGFDIRALPSYINFYGTNFSNTPKLTPSKKIAQNLFGTFLEVDYQESSPKIIIQYVGKNSTRPDMQDNSKYKFTDDSFNIGNVNNNPIMITLPKVFKTGDLAKTNKVVAFEVSFGDQNQSIFKGVTLDQATIKNTSESFYVLENLARSESGSASHNVDIGLYDYYRQAAYSCDVTCMGNSMIQPTMYFYLKNIPMFKGTYWITEVSHSIRNGSMTTTFKGSRMPYTALPDLKDSFMSSYRTLFDKLQQKAVNKINGSDKVTTTSQQLTTSNGTFTYDSGDPKYHVNGEVITTDANVTKSGIPYNGFNNSRYITQVTHPSGTWLRAQAVTMGEEKYKINNDSVMSIISKSTSKAIPTVTWETAFKHTNEYQFYTTKFVMDKISVSGTTTTFFNPKTNGNKITVVTNFDVDRSNNTNTTPQKFSGPIDVMKETEPYGIALSSKLMRDLRLQDGDIVYFNVG